MYFKFIQDVFCGKCHFKCELLQHKVVLKVYLDMTFLISEASSVFPPPLEVKVEPAFCTENQLSNGVIGISIGTVL